MEAVGETIVRDGTTYQIGWYEPDDEEGLVRLFSTIREERDREWFRRTYVDLPYLDHVPVVVARAGDEVVGARPYVACEFRWDDETLPAIIPQHLVVHPEHRGRGVYRAMNAVGNPRYDEGETVLRMTDPVNETTVSACREMGHTILGTPTRYFRIQRPGVVAERLVLDGESRLIRALSRPIARGYLSVRDRIARSDDPLSVTEYEGVRADQLGALYERRIPDTPHPVHDRAFFEWRYGVPRWRPNATYVAERDGRPVAAAVVQTARSSVGILTTHVRHVVPLTGGEARSDGIHALLDRIVADHPDSDVIRLTEPSFSPSLLSARGFVSDERFPLSALQGSKPKLAVKVIGDAGDRELDDEALAALSRSFWSLKF